MPVNLPSGLTGILSLILTVLFSPEMTSSF